MIRLILLHTVDLTWKPTDWILEDKLSFGYSHVMPFGGSMINWRMYCQDMNFRARCDYDDYGLLDGVGIASRRHQRAVEGFATRWKSLEGGESVRIEQSRVL